MNNTYSPFYFLALHLSQVIIHLLKLAASWLWIGPCFSSNASSSSSFSVRERPSIVSIIQVVRNDSDSFDDRFLSLSPLAGVINSASSSNSGYTWSNASCRQRTTVIAGSIVGGGCGLVLCLITAWSCYKHCKGKPLTSNTAFVQRRYLRKPPAESAEGVPFKSGVWSSRHMEDTKWRGPDRCLLSFDHQLSKVTGSGYDHLGIFTIDGVFSTKTARMGLTKIYAATPCLPSTHLKSKILIQLSWNFEQRHFEGKWYIRTSKYHAENKFYLKLHQPQTLSLYETH